MKRTIRMMLFFGLCWLMTSMCYAEGMQVTIDGKVTPDLKGPIIVNDRALLPARSVFETFGFEMKWDAETRMVYAKRAGYTVEMKIDDKTGRINGENVALELAPVIAEGKTYVPLRFVAEAIGAIVSYSPESRMINIDTKKLSEPIIITDPIFKSWLEGYLNKKEILVSDVFYFTKLDMSRQGLYRLDGIEKFVNLKELSLRQNNIADISPVFKIKGLSILDASGNKIRSLDGIRQATGLKVLDITENQISSFELLTGMKSITSLKILGNATQDYSPLYFTKDQYLVLDVDKSKIEKPAKNSKVLNNYSSFEVRIDPNSEWVSASKAGTTSYTHEDIARLMKEQQATIGNHLDTVYEVLQVLQSSNNWANSDVSEKTIASTVLPYKWLYQDRTKKMLETLRATPLGIATFVNEALANDYQETGMIVFVTKQGTIKASNYVRMDEREEYDKDLLGGGTVKETRMVERYYSFDSSAYCLTNEAILENGSLEDFMKSTSYGTGVIRTKNLQDYLNFARSRSSDIVLAFKVKYSEGESPYVPFDISVFSSGVIFMPNEYRNSTSVLYQDGSCKLEFAENDTKNPFYTVQN